VKRRGFLAALAAVPFLRRWAKAAPAREIVPVGVPDVFEFSVGNVGSMSEGRYTVAYDPGGTMGSLVVTAIDYKAGTITVQASRG